MRRLAALPATVVRAFVVLAVVGLASGCSRTEPPPVRLDGSPRFPADEGILSAVDDRQVTLDGARTYKVSERLRSFSTYDLRLEPVRNRLGQYVQVGLDGEALVWMAGVAAVVPGDPPRVFYSGRLKEVDGKGRAIFADGTVLTLAPGVRPPVPQGFVQAEIDARSHRVLRLTPS